MKNYNHNKDKSGSPKTPRETKQLIGKSANEWAESLWEKLTERIAAIKSKNEIKQIMENLITQDEKKMVLRRLAVLALLHEGKSYQEIGEILWVSPQTISTIKKNSTGLIGNYKSYRNFYGGPIKFSDDIKYEEPFWVQIRDFLETLPQYGRFKTPSIEDVRRMRRARERKRHPY